MCNGVKPECMRQNETQLWQVGGLRQLPRGQGGPSSVRKSYCVPGSAPGPLRTLLHIILTLVSFLQNLHLFFSASEGSSFLFGISAVPQALHTPEAGARMEPAAGWDRGPGRHFRVPGAQSPSQGPRWGREDVWGISVSLGRTRQGDTRLGAGQAGWGVLLLALRRGLGLSNKDCCRSLHLTLFCYPLLSFSSPLFLRVSSP